MSFSDHFSGHAAEYAQFRPTYPATLFEYLASITPAYECALDCGTGNGQAAIGLAPYFRQVIATEPSPEQLHHAFEAPNIEYRVAPAEQSGLPENSVDLITVAQAFHWFSMEKFFEEARRILKPKGIIALWTYTLLRVTPEIDTLLDEFYTFTDPYWPPERRWVDEEYRTIPFPFEEIIPPQPFFMERTMSLHDYLHYLRTWSAVKKYQRQHGSDPVHNLQMPLEQVWGGPTLERNARWQLFLRVGRV